MPRFSFSSIRVRLILVVFLASLPALGLILYTAREEQRWAATAAQQEALRLAHLVAEDYTELIEETEGWLIAIAQLPAVRNHTSAECNESFQALLKHYHDHYTNLEAIGRDGKTFCSAIPLTQPLNAAHEPWFRQAVQSRDFTLSEYRIGRVSGKAQVSLTYPILGYDGQVQALVLAGLDLARIEHLIAKVKLPAGSVAILIDRNGTILAHYPDPKKMVGQSFSNVAIFKTIMTKHREGKAEFTDVDGISRLYAFTHLGVHPRYMDLSVILGIPKEVVFTQANWSLKRNLILVGLVGLLAMAVVWFGGNLSIVSPVSALALATKRLASGDLSVRTGPSYQDGELGELQHAFDEMAETLQTRQAEARRAEQQLRSSHEQLRSLAAHLLSAQEDERKRVARELHDETSQSLTSLIVGLKVLESVAILPEVREKAAELRALTGEILRDVHELAFQLRPSLLDHLGLPVAIQRLTEDYTQKMGLHIDLQISGFEESRLPSTTEIALYRLVQEALTNVAKHAEAKNVSVILRRGDSKVLAIVEDDGKGFHAAEIMASTSEDKKLGLFGMEERAALIGGKLTIESTPGNGTTVFVEVPV